MPWKFLNAVGFLLWLVCVPVSAKFGWYYSIPFVAMASIYANAIAHLAGWRADAPDPDVIERLDHIIELLERRADG